MKTFLLCLLSCFHVFSVCAADPDLGRLQKSYDEAKKRALDPVQTTYQTELQKLMEQRTKAGKLDAALEVKAELERLAEERSQLLSEAAQPNDSALRKKLIKGRFVFFFAPPRSKLTTFSGNGKIDEGANTSEFKWKLEGSELSIFNETGQLTYSLEYDAGTDSFRTNGKPCLYISRKAYLENAPK
jgi:hypothetical protein